MQHMKCPKNVQQLTFRHSHSHLLTQRLNIFVSCMISSGRNLCCSVILSPGCCFKTLQSMTHRTVESRISWKWYDCCQRKPLFFLFFCSVLFKTFKIRYCFDERDQAYIADQGSLNPLNSRSRFSSLSLSFFYPGKVLLSMHALFQLNPVPHQYQCIYSHLGATTSGHKSFTVCQLTPLLKSSGGRRRGVQSSK